MASQNYERLNPVDFGNQLISSLDLDPVYTALNGMILSNDQRDRWLVAYWCFYHCGFASFASEFEGKDFWRIMNTASENKVAAPDGGRWPRGSERRHFRGAQSARSISSLEKRYGQRPQDMVEAVVPTGSGGTDFKEVAKLVQEHQGFGPWISFKVGDMLERVVGHDISFDEASVFMFKDPVKGAGLVSRWIALGEPEQAETAVLLEALDIPVTAGDIETAVEYLTEKFSHHLAPPNTHRVRPVGLQEVETVLCKWKSHLRGHYPLMNDTHEIREGLTPHWGLTAMEFRSAMGQ